MEEQLNILFYWLLPKQCTQVECCQCTEAGGRRDTTPQKGECLNIDNASKQIPRILQYILYKERKGRSPNSTTTMKKHLTLIAQRADLNNPEEVETAIARYTCVDIHTKKPTNRPATNNFKTKLCSTYKGYCTLNKIQWEKPTYTKEEHSIQPPTQERCNQLIASAKGEMSLKIDVSTQTGLRPIEVTGEKGIKGKDIHPDQNTITAMVTKGCNQRPPLKITPELTARLQAHITKHQIRPEQPLFKGSSKTYTCHFIRLKHTLAKKLNDPSILSIRLYDLRHAYITKQLRRTQNTESVRQLIGHKQLNTTQKYLHLLADQSGEWTVEGTTDKNRAIQLITQDYIYVNTTPDGTMIYKKAK